MEKELEKYSLSAASFQSPPLRAAFLRLLVEEHGNLKFPKKLNKGAFETSLTHCSRCGCSLPSGSNSSNHPLISCTEKKAMTPKTSEIKPHNRAKVAWPPIASAFSTFCRERRRSQWMSTGIACQHPFLHLAWPTSFWAFCHCPGGGARAGPTDLAILVPPCLRFLSSSTSCTTDSVMTTLALRALSMIPSAS